MDKNGDKAKIPLQQVLTSIQKREKKTSPKSNTSNKGETVIMSIIIFKKRNKSQKTSMYLSNLYANNYS